jgi:hypothetical protein
MAFDFPASPVQGQIYNPAGGPIYAFDSPVWKILPAGSRATAEERNRIVNGAMIVSQEETVDTSITSGKFPWDQWGFGGATGGAPVALARTVDGDNYLRINAGNTLDTAIAASDIVYCYTKIEGKDIKDLQWGTANAVPVVLRFTARCFTVASLVVGVAVKSGTTAGDQHFIKNITLTNNWQDFVIPIPGCTAGTWQSDIVAGMLISFCAMAGSSYAGGTDGVWNTGGNYYGSPGNIMAVAQSCLDLGKVGLYADPNGTGKAPPWQYPDYATELSRCKRYWQQQYLMQVFGQVVSGTSYLICQPLPVNPRFSGAACSAVNYAINNGFAVTPGSVAMLPDNTTMSEGRNATASQAFGRYGSLVTINARM